MNTRTIPETMRRSSRVPLTLPIHVTSLEPSIHFSEDCETVVVNAHGCAVRSPHKLAAGVPVHFHNQEGRETTAYVVDCKPLGADHRSWLVAARLDKPENFWGVQPCPQDWMLLSQTVPNGTHPAIVSDARPRKAQAHEAGLRVVPAKGQESLTEDRVRTMLGEILRPLHEEVIQLRERVARPEAKRSTFEVSLGQIPPELEEQLWLRLRQELGAEVLQHATAQTEQVLATAKSSIGQSLSSAKQEFRQHLTEELQLVVVRAKRLSDEIDDGVREQLHAGLEAFHEQERKVGAHFEERGEEFFRAMQQRLNDDNDRRLREVEQVQAAIDSDSLRMQTLIADLSTRIHALNESASHLESGLDEHLSQLSSEILAGARGQLEDQVDNTLIDLQTRAAKELSNQLDVACGRLKMIQKGIETSVTELLNAQASRTMQSFEQSLDDQAGQTVVRWRASLARDLTNVAKILGTETQSTSD